MSYFAKDKWWTSPFNEEGEVRERLRIPQKVKIHDATLRDGEQTPGVVFSVGEKVRIAEMLADVGVERIEAGMPAVSEEDAEAVKQIAALGLDAEVFAFARAMNKDIDMAAELGATGVIIEIPIGYPKLKYQFDWNWQMVAEKSIACINYAKSCGLYTVYFPYDTTRARGEDLDHVIGALMKEAAPDAIGIVDTMGCALPETIQYLVRRIKKQTGGLPVEVHTHNDFGMAVATELAGIAAGADCVHSCINGLGERTGNAALEELIVGMELLLDIPGEYKLEKLPALCEELSRMTGIPIPRNKPVTGSGNYTRESGIGVNLLLEKPLAMFATAPQLYGRTATIALGKKSGKASVEYFLDRNGLEAEDGQIREILAQVKHMGTTKKRLLTNEEFLEIYHRTVE